ncbi:NHL repeat-containing protein [Nocardioides humi]|uniref:NHL repeat-containing protein n=1 Tax=Nocardioides humi TaxID=449461 RepID=A0ABN2A9A4_9ACTN|nr:NHL repeat-containing protein [Nocardioides humi]
MPSAVATDAAGRVYTIGSNAGYGDDNSTVRLYDANGGLVSAWEVPFPNIGDLTVDAAGNVHIADYSGSIVADIPAAVYVFTPAGTYLRAYAMRPCCDVTEAAGGVGIGPNGRSYVASPTSDQVVVFNADGSRYKASSGSGTAPGKLKSPWGLDVAPDGSVVVADRENSRVQVFTLAGGYLGTITATTKRGGFTMKTTALAFGPGQELYVSGTLYPFENGIAKYVPAGVGSGGAKVKAPKKGVKVAKRKVVRKKAVTKAVVTVTGGAKKVKIRR